MHIIHLTGLPCSGETHVCNAVNYPVWDVKKDFYEKYNILSDEGMDWERF